MVFVLNEGVTFVSRTNGEARWTESCVSVVVGGGRGGVGGGGRSTISSINGEAGSQSVSQSGCCPFTSLPHRLLIDGRRSRGTCAF